MSDPLNRRVSTPERNCFIAINPMPCQSNHLQSFLLGEASADQCAQIESHLSECVDCRDELQRRAASEDFWETAAETLGTPVSLLPIAQVSSYQIETGHAPSEQAITIDASPDAQRPPVTHSTLLRHLRQWCDPPPKANSIGQIDKYSIQEIIGHGGMGVVLRAVDTQLDRTVAIKTLLQPAAVETSSRDRLIREARAVASLKHEYVIDMHSIEQWRNVPFIVMPFVEGGTLAEYAENHAFSTEQILNVARQLAAALSAAHELRLVHRDIKPTNILLQQELNHVLLADFGLARVGGDFTVTQSGMAPGTPGWMSPEQALAATVDHRSDQFSLGSVMYWMATGKCPFESDSCYATLMKLVNEPALPIKDSNPKTPDYLVALIDRMMCKAPDNRFDDMRQVAELVSECLNHSRDNRVPLPSDLRVTVAGRRLRDHPTIFIAALMATVALVGLIPLALDWNGPTNSRHRTATSPLATASPSIETDAKKSKRPERIGRTIQGERYGPLDEIDLSNAVDDFQNHSNVRYWLRRLAYLSADEIPADLIPMVSTLSTDEDTTIAELALVILRKNPFVEVTAESGEKDSFEISPFVIVDEDETP